MRRADREITALEDIAGILRASTVCRLAFHGDPCPYIVPMSYGFTLVDGRFTLYFHCAGEGEKLRRMQANPHVAFEVDGAVELYAADKACGYTTAFESVVGQGTLSLVHDREDKRAALSVLMANHAPGRAFTFDDAAVDAVTVLRLDVASLTAKRNPRRA